MAAGMTFGNPNAPISGANLGTRGRGLPQATDASRNIAPAGHLDSFNPLGAKTPADMLSKGGSPGGGGTSPMMSVDPATGGRVSSVNKMSFAPTGAQTAANPGQFAGTSFDPTRNIMAEAQGTPGGANSMGMQGAGMTGQGIAGYTQGNGPLDRNRFTPEGGAAQAWYNQVFGQNNPNQISYLGFADALGRNALGGRQNWSDAGAIQDQVNYLNSQAGQQWLQQLTADKNAQQQQQQQQQTTTGTGTGSETPVIDPAAKPEPAPNPAQTQQQQSSQASQIVNYLTQNGIQARDIPIGLRLQALGVQGQNPLVGIGGQNPIMQLLMSGGQNNPLLSLLQGMR